MLTAPPKDCQQHLIAEYHIQPATAITYTVKSGQYIQIIDLEGSQCSDLLVFAEKNYSQYLDSTVTRTLNGITHPQAGLQGKYFSQTMQPLFEVIQDTCGRHDNFLLACTAKYYEDAGYPGHPSCSENFNQVLQPYGISPRLGWPAINFFYNTAISDAAIVGGESWSRPGDYVLLQASQDLLCASSSCADDIDPTNAWHPTPIQIRIYDSSASFPKAIGRHLYAADPPRLTQASGFTARIQTLTDHLTEYNGFWVPNSFANYGVQAEYWALRERAAIMDLSALRKFEITGRDAARLLQIAFSRDIEKLTPGQSAYGCLLNHHGGIVDDGIVFHFGPKFRYVGNCDTNADWLRQVVVEYGLIAEIQPADLHNLALQGPDSRQILQALTDTNLDELSYFHFTETYVANIPALISRTGYTGELGYELFLHPDDCAALWDSLIQAGQSSELLPMGMFALDRARIEAGLLSAGREFNDLISPYQAGIGWAVALKKPEMIGKAALEKIKPHPPFVAVGLSLEGNEIAVPGSCLHPINQRGRVGTITSATFSPILNRSIALAQVVPEAAAMGTELEVGFMDGLKRRVRATVGPLSAYDPTKSRVRS
jgi:aminomethyltransferase